MPDIPWSTGTEVVITHLTSGMLKILEQIYEKRLYPLTHQTFSSLVLININ